MSDDADIAVGSVDWLEAWKKFRHAALVEAVREAESGIVRFNGKELSDGDCADIDNRLYEDWCLEQLAASPDETVNYAYPPPKPKARTLPTLPNVPPQVDGNG